ncbi:MAG: molybdenum cofactor guanylyltransferase, partial [Gemmatimonadota bacterium]|nr:molybdenum cofactor guanylyltransferase [Gemmatimonadota bacterium]
VTRVRVRLLGAVLAGGRSRRFGRDKTAESIRGAPMIERAVDALASCCADVVVVSSREDTPVGPWRTIPDDRPDLGPLAGIETALAEAARFGCGAVFVLAADLPLVQSGTVADVVAELGEGRAAAAAREGDPDFEPLCAVYRTDCLDDVAALLDGGESAARALLERVGGARAPVDPRTLVNVNTEADLAMAETLENELESSG